MLFHIILIIEWCIAHIITGEHALLTCRVCGRPRPQVQWRRPDGSVISSSPRYSMAYTEDGTVMLQVCIL